MKNVFLIIVSCLFITACSNDDFNSLEGDYSITGKFMAPNTTDPIANAVISLLKDEVIVSTTHTDPIGSFTFNNIASGDYQINLQKGLFSSQQDVSITPSGTVLHLDLDIITITSFPKIGVVTGLFDNIENILYDIGLINPLNGDPLFDVIEGIDLSGRSSAQTHSNHAHTGGTARSSEIPVNVAYDFGELLEDPTTLATYDILFLNCGLNTENAENDLALFNYISNGGIVYATDWAYPFIQTVNSNDGTAHLSFQQPYKSGESLATEATILNDDLNAWLDLNFGITIENTVLIDEFLPSWQVVNTFHSETVTPWLNGPITYNNGTDVVTEDKDLAFSYQLGDGGVLYSSFHTENSEDGFSNTDRVIEYLVFELSTLAALH